MFFKNIIDKLYIALMATKEDHNTGFQEERNFFRRKLATIAENIYHNIGPCSCGVAHM
jgi:hypothetical protein